MSTKAILTSLSVLLVLMAATPQIGMAIEKVKVGTGVKASASYNLPWMAAEEKGLWKENGLEAEIVLFSAATPLLQAMAARHMDVGIAAVPAIIQAAAAGAPVVIVAHLLTKRAGFYLWVRADSPIKGARDLKGSKIAVSNFGAAGHAYARMMAKALGLEREIKFVALGSNAVQLAALKVGQIDGSVNMISAMTNLLATGEVRSAFSVADYLPKKWVEHVIVVRKDFLDSKPEVVRKVAKVFSEASRFAKENPQWSLEKLKGKEFLLSDKGAEIVYDNLVANIEFGKIDREGLENVRNFLVEYGIVAKEKAPPLDAIYRNIFE